MNSDDHQNLQDKIESLEMQIISLEQMNRRLKQDKLYLELNEAKVFEIQRLASIYSWEVSILSRRVKCSDQLLKILNKTSEDRIFIEELLAIIHPDDVVSFERLYDDSVSQKFPFEVIHRLVLPNGEKRSVNHYCKTFFLENGMPLKSMGLMQDITQLQQIEQRLKMAIAESEQLNQNLEAKVKERTQELQGKNQALASTLQELQQAQIQLVHSEKMSSLGQLVAGIAHEINNPVSFIHGNLTHAHTYTLELLHLLTLYETHSPNPHPDIQAEQDAIDLDFLKTDILQLFKSMRSGTNRIRDIVKSMRIFSRLDESELKAVDLHEGIDSTLVILQTRFRTQDWRSEIQIIKNYAALPFIECYAGQLNQVFMNIFNNAIDAIESQARSDNAQYQGRIKIQTHISHQHAVIEISDNGMGMDATAQTKIFDPFFTTKDVGKGSGMGMAIAHQIITKKHGGAIECESDLDKGTTFTITLPLAVD